VSRPQTQVSDEVFGCVWTGPHPQLWSI